METDFVRVMTGYKVTHKPNGALYSLLMDAVLTLQVVSREVPA